MRIVLDSNILVRANPLAVPHGLAKELLLAAIAAPNVLIISPPILIEVARVLCYPHVRSRWPLSDHAIRTYVDLLEQSAVLVTLPSETPAVVSDPDDDPILQTAIVGRADVLCSRDAAFRAPAVEEVCRAEGIRVVDDISLMQDLRRTQ